MTIKKTDNTVLVQTRVPKAVAEGIAKSAGQEGRSVASYLRWVLLSLYDDGVAGDQTSPKRR